MAEDSLNENKKLWRAIFQSTKIVQLLNQREMTKEIGTEPIVFDVQSFGKIEVTAKPAVPLGANFMSKVYSISAVTVNNGKQFSSFVKVFQSASQNTL